MNFSFDVYFIKACRRFHSKNVPCVPWQEYLSKRPFIIIPSIRWQKAHSRSLKFSETWLHQVQTGKRTVVVHSLPPFLTKQSAINSPCSSLCSTSRFVVKNWVRVLIIFLTLTYDCVRTKSESFKVFWKSETVSKKPLVIPEGTCGDLTFHFGIWKIFFQKVIKANFFILICSLFVKAKARHEESIILAYITVSKVWGQYFFF